MDRSDLLSSSSDSSEDNAPPKKVMFSLTPKEVRVEYRNSRENTPETPLSSSSSDTTSDPSERTKQQKGQRRQARRAKRAQEAEPQNSTYERQMNWLKQKKQLDKERLQEREAIELKECTFAPEKINLKVKPKEAPAKEKDAMRQHVQRQNIGRTKKQSMKEIPHATGAKWTGEKTKVKAFRLSGQKESLLTADGLPTFPESFLARTRSTSPRSQEEVEREIEERMKMYDQDMEIRMQKVFEKYETALEEERSEFAKQLNHRDETIAQLEEMCGILQAKNKKTEEALREATDKAQQPQNEETDLLETVIENQERLKSEIGALQEDWKTLPSTIKSMEQRVVEGMKEGKKDQERVDHIESIAAQLSKFEKMVLKKLSMLTSLEDYITDLPSETMLRDQTERVLSKVDLVTSETTTSIALLEKSVKREGDRVDARMGQLEESLKQMLRIEVAEMKQNMLGSWKDVVKSELSAKANLLEQYQTRLEKIKKASTPP